MTAAVVSLSLGVVVALAAGILIGRYYVPDDRELRRSARHAAHYVRALTSLLARDRDAAVGELRRVVSENISELEPYFALGALFRSRGEWERAIRIHQALEIRAGGDKKLARRAHFELGLDFRAAGMPRRAIRALEEYIVDAPKDADALRVLAGLYERQGRFGEAAAAWHRVFKLAGERSPREVHTAASAATQALARGAIDEAKRAVKQAERADADHPHARAAAAELAAARGRHEEAGERTAGIARAHPALAPAVAELSLALEEKRRGGAAREDAAAAVKRRIEAPWEMIAPAERPAEIELALAGLERAAGDAERAASRVGELAKRTPGWWAAQIEAGRQALERGDRDAMETALSGLVGRSEGAALPDGKAAFGRWRCASCGDVREAFAWRCEACSQWGCIRLEGSERAPGAPRMGDARQGELAEGRSAELRSGAGEPRALPAAEEENRTRGRPGRWLAGAASALWPRVKAERADAADSAREGDGNPTARGG